MGVICSSCGRDIDALGQDNMSCTRDPLCEDCFGDRMWHAAPMARSLVERERTRLAVRDELDRLRRVHLRAAQFGQGVGYGDGVDAAIR